MTMAGIGVERAITYNANVGHDGFDGSYGLADEVVFIICLTAIGGAQFVWRIWEQGDGFDAELMSLFDLFNQQIDTIAHHARHGGDGFGFIIAGNDE